MYIVQVAVLRIDSLGFYERLIIPGNNNYNFVIKHLSLFSFVAIPRMPLFVNIKVICMYVWAPELIRTEI